MAAIKKLERSVKGRGVLITGIRTACQRNRGKALRAVAEIQLDGIHRVRGKLPARRGVGDADGPPAARVTGDGDQDPRQAHRSASPGARGSR